MRARNALIAALALTPRLCLAIACPRGQIWVHGASGQMCVKDQLGPMITALKGQRASAGPASYLYDPMIAALEQRQRDGYLIKDGKWVTPDGKVEPPPLPDQVERALEKPKDGSSAAEKPPSEEKKPDDEKKPEAAAPPASEPQPAETPKSADPVPVINPDAARDLDQWSSKIDGHTPAASPEGSDANPFSVAGGGRSGQVATKADDLNGPESSTSKVGGSSSVKNLGGRLKDAFNNAGKLGAGELGAAADRMGALGPGAKAGPGPGQGGPAGTRAPAADGLSNPKTMQEFVLAAGPYKESFNRAGLRAAVGPQGQPQVLHRDGTPASPSELSALGATIRQEPSALARYPSYFDPGHGGISRGDYTGLKTAYKDNAGLRDTEFKDIALKDDRDFKRSESCDVVSGECNPHAEKSYAKDEDVPPGELKKIWDAIEGYAADAERHFEEAVEARTEGKKIGAGLNVRKMIDGMETGRGAEGGGMTRALTAGWRWLTGSNAASAASSGAATANKRGSAAPGAIEAAAVPAPSGRRIPAALLAALLAGAAAAAFALRRRLKSEEKGE